jgi:hypothetical protein
VEELVVPEASGCGAEAVDELLDGLLERRVVCGGEGAAGKSAGFGGGFLAYFADERTDK